MRYVLGVLLLVVVAAAAVAYVVVGRTNAVAIVIVAPAKAIGVEATLEVTVETPGSRLSRLDIAIEQNGRSTPLFTLTAPGQATLRQDTPDRIRISRPIGGRALPDLRPGTARLLVTAAPKTLLWARGVVSVWKDFAVRFAPPRVAVVSTGHYVNLGGSEMVVYAVSPPDVESGVEVGDMVYPGFPAAGAGVSGADPGLRVAFFALLNDQDLGTPVRLFARDDAGNQARARFDCQALPTSFLRSRIELNDAFLQRVVPEIAERSPEMKIKVTPGESYLPAYLRLNNDLRRQNGDKILSLAKSSSAQTLWKGPFLPLGSAKVEARFADHRTYFYRGQEVDRQIHLGFDLAVTKQVPVVAGNDGTVVFADYLGIYGNCVVIDHGMGLQSLYGHLSSIEVKVGDAVKRDQQVARSGMTGLAGGDHLHFSIQLQGRPVNPVEWWDRQWIEDRITRKLRDAGAK